jgi:hypothetical protein
VGALRVSSWFDILHYLLFVYSFFWIFMTHTSPLLQLNRPGTIALDCDGVLLNFIAHWEKIASYALGRPIHDVMNAYDLQARYGLSKREVDHVMSTFVRENGWANLPALQGAFDGAKALQTAGHRVIVVTAIEPEFAEARLENFKKHGFTPDAMHCVGAQAGHTKAEAYAKEQPDAVVDDRLVYLHEARTIVQNKTPELVWVNDGVHQHGHDSTHVHHEVFSLHDWALPISQNQSFSSPPRQKSFGF